MRQPSPAALEIAVEPIAPVPASVPGAVDGQPGSLGPRAADPPADDSPGPGGLSGRVLRPRTLVSFLLAAVLLVVFARRLDLDVGEVWRTVRTANPVPYALAFGVWYGSFFVRAVRWRQMLARVGIDAAHGYRLPGTAGLVEIFVLSWFANCIVPAKLGDAYRSYLLKRATGASFSTALGTIVAERLTDLTVLFLTMSAVGFAIFQGRLPTEAARAFLLGVALLVVAVLALGGMWLTRRTIERRLPARVREQYARLHDAVFRCLRRPEAFFAMGAVIWLGEGLRVWLVGRAVDADLSLSSALFVALMGSLLTTVPFTPAGLGLVELGLIGVLTQVMGLPTALAAAIVLLDRVVSYWSTVAVGLVLYLRRLRRGAT